MMMINRSFRLLNDDDDEAKDIYYDGNDLNLKNVKIFCFFNIYKNVIISYHFFTRDYSIPAAAAGSVAIFEHFFLNIHHCHFISNDDDNDI